MECSTDEYNNITGLAEDRSTPVARAQVLNGRSISSGQSIVRAREASALGNPLARLAPGLRSAVVTGVGGFIGSHLAQALLASGVQVTGIDSRAAQEQHVTENLRDCLGDKRFRFVRADLRRTDARPLVTGHDVVFHLAALAGVRSSWGERFEEYLAVNVLGTHRLLQACDQAAVPRLVLASSSSVYGGVTCEPSKEDDAISPRSPYGVTKLAAEQLALAFAQHPATKTSVIVLRYFSVYGPRQRPDMLISRVLQAALTGQPIHVFGDGQQRRDFTFVGDVVSATIAAAQVDAGAEVVNIGTGSPRSVGDVLRIARHLTGRPVPIDRKPAAAGDVEGTWADTAKASRLLAHHSTTGLEDGMAEHWMWIRERQANKRQEGDRSRALDPLLPMTHADGITATGASS